MFRTDFTHLSSPNHTHSHRNVCHSIFSFLFCIFSVFLLNAAGNTKWKRKLSVRKAGDYFKSFLLVAAGAGVLITAIEFLSCVNQAKKKQLLHLSKADHCPKMLAYNPLLISVTLVSFFATLSPSQQSQVIVTDHNTFVCHGSFMSVYIPKVLSSNLPSSIYVHGRSV